MAASSGVLPFVDTLLRVIDADSVRHVGENAINRFVRHLPEHFDAVGVNEFVAISMLGDLQLVTVFRVVTGQNFAVRSHKVRAE